MTKKIVIARVEIVKGRESDFMALTPGLIEATQAESGCLSYTLYQNPNNASQFIVYEEYVNDEAFARHGASEHFQSFAKNVQPLLAKELDIQIF